MSRVSFTSFQSCIQELRETWSMLGMLNWAILHFLSVFFFHILKQVPICHSCLGKCSNVLLWSSGNVCGQRKVSDGESWGVVDNIWIFIFAWTYPLRLQQKSAEGAFFFSISTPWEDQTMWAYEAWHHSYFSLCFLSHLCHYQLVGCYCFGLTPEISHVTPQPIISLHVKSQWIISTTPVTSSAPCLSSQEACSTSHPSR